MSAEPVPSPSAVGAPKKAQPIPKPVVKAKKKRLIKKPPKKPASKDLNKSEESRKVAGSMTAGGQKARPSLIVQELAKQNVMVAPAHVSIVLKRLGFMPRRKRNKSAGIEIKGKASAEATKASAIGIEDLLAAKKVVEAFGGSDQAIEVIRALKRLEG